MRTAAFHASSLLLQELRTGTAVDMPPEAVLQRPSVLQHVLALLQPADRASRLPKAALQFLLCFVWRVKWALGMALDPDHAVAPAGQSHVCFVHQCHHMWRCHPQG